MNKLNNRMSSIMSKKCRVMRCSRMSRVRSVLKTSVATRMSIVIIMKRDH